MDVMLSKSEWFYKQQPYSLSKLNYFCCKL
ncbi:UNVERIFIED_ORG: hypothetical protein QE398_003433 [Atlantibacter sp. SORGH_AS 304]|jgi:hypothetical protein|nr:hypothetical protein [Atlantibacter sp. SORGH_AS_0304]